MNQNWLTIEEKNGTQVLTQCSVFAEDELIIPEGVTIIEEGAFDGCHDIKSMFIPGSMVCIKPSYKLKSINLQAVRDGCIVWHLNVLDFNGEIPETNGIFAKSYIYELRINQPRKKCKIPSDILEALHMDNPRHNWSIVYAAPELCEEESSIPGYIRVTKAFLDNRVEGAEHDGDIIDINTKYIVSVEPIDIERYHPVKASIIRCALNAYERETMFIVYESCDMVRQKIATSLRMLSEQVGGAAGLLNQLETLLKPCPAN